MPYTFVKETSMENIRMALEKNKERKKQGGLTIGAKPFVPKKKVGNVIVGGINRDRPWMQQERRDEKNIAFKNDNGDEFKATLSNIPTRPIILTAYDTEILNFELSRVFNGVLKKLSKSDKTYKRFSSFKTMQTSRFAVLVIMKSVYDNDFEDENYIKLLYHFSKIIRDIWHTLKDKIMLTESRLSKYFAVPCKFSTPKCTKGCRNLTVNCEKCRDIIFLNKKDKILTFSLRLFIADQIEVDVIAFQFKTKERKITRDNEEEDPNLSSVYSPTTSSEMRMSTSLSAVINPVYQNFVDRDTDDNETQETETNK